MEYSKIKDLLDLYFKGNTTLDQEMSLRTYFNSEGVDDRLKPYTVLFNTFDKAAQDVFEGSLLIPEKTRSQSKVVVKGSSCNDFNYWCSRFYVFNQQ